MFENIAFLKKLAFLSILIWTAGLFLGCASDSGSRKAAGEEEEEPFVYHSDTEVPDRPGLFTGEKGEWVIYRSDKPLLDSEETQQPPSQKGKESEKDSQPKKKKVE